MPRGSPGISQVTLPDGAGGTAASITAIDLAALAKLVGCTVADLAEGARADANAIHAEGALASSKSQLVFEMQPRANEEEAPEGVTTALISVASRPGVLDQGALPKVLTPLGGDPLIWHVLRQLALGGITHAVIIVGARGSQIREALEAHPPVDPSVMTLEFVELGEKYGAGFACSLLEARAALGHRPFLLCTPDHIFDPKIVSSLRNVPLAGWDPGAEFSAVALVETKVQLLTDILPITAVRVRLRDGLPRHPTPEEPLGFADLDEPPPELLAVRHIGRSIGTPVHGIEAGLYACGPHVLDALEAQKAARAYFTLAQAMADLASRGSLAAQTTGERAWYAIETPDQLQLATEAVVDGDGAGVHGRRTHFPWQVRIARADSFSTHPLTLMRQAAREAAHGRQRASRLSAPSTALTLTPRDAVEVSKQRLVIAVSAAAASGNAILRVAPDEKGRVRQTHAFSLLAAEFPSSLASTRSSRVGSPFSSTLASPVSNRIVELRSPLLGMVSPVGSERRPPPFSARPSMESEGAKEAAAAANLVDGSEMVVASLAGSLVPLEGSDGDATLSIELPSGPRREAGEGLTGEQMVDSMAYLVSGSGENATQMLAVPQSPYDPRAAEDGGEVSYFHLPSAVTAVRLVTIDEPLSDVEKGVVGAAAHPTLAIAVESTVPMIGWALLMLALVCSSFSGSLADIQTQSTKYAPPSDMMRGAWRGMCSTLTLTAISLYQNHGRSLLSLLRLSRREAAEVAGAGLAVAVNLGAFQSALMRTSIAHAATFESMSSLWLVAGAVLSWLCAKGPSVSRTTLGAVMVGCFGATLCFREPPNPDGAGHQVTSSGDIMALASGIGAAFFLISAENLRLALDPLAFLISVLGIYTLISGTVAHRIDECTPTFSLNPSTGYFGWLTLSFDRLPLQLAITGLVDVAGYLSFIAVMKYVPALMVSAVMLLGPFVSTLEGVLLGVESVPGLWTVAGALVITIGSGIIAYESQTKTKTFTLGEIG